VALDHRTGRVRWRFDTIRDRWRYSDAYGDGAWQTPTVDDDGAVYCRRQRLPGGRRRYAARRGRHRPPVLREVPAA
jgi:hypothetical protein